MKVFMRILSRACRENLQRKVLQYFNLLCGLWVGGRLLAGWGGGARAWWVRVGVGASGRRRVGWVVVGGPCVACCWPALGGLSFLS